ncbi:phytanoyl-CoA dioxygenase family protein [Paenibacillus sp. IB182496]|uniref:Phytanoyl-CoA dioxygenase family protein n=1 Tax=Paenibacillus sabuli TaxID=2772509 RepID=A0A927BWG6_9BACL|nr:phytanoyl-CoA dioxygenase family protein [Paenibacillus sabuli]MBD2846910.1 phytanoyl-CoA dioxygenase family protein [Paenibacillus sabuli]
MAQNETQRKNETEWTPEEISQRLYRYDKIADRLDGWAAWGEKALAQYRSAGYVAVEGAYSQRQIDDALAALHTLVFEDAKGARIQLTKPSSELKSYEERERAVRKVSDYVECDDRLRAIAYDPQLLARVEAILGDEAVLVQDMALLKPPNGGGEKPWHQDMAYGPLAFQKAVVGVWIALDEAGLDNGCMHIIPGSHADGAVPHYAIRDLQLCDAHVPVEQDVAVPLQPGGLLFFHGLLKHGTPFNLSAKRRRALQFHYAPRSAAKLSPKEYKRFFTNEMTGAEC